MIRRLLPVRCGMCSLSTACYVNIVHLCMTIIQEKAFFLLSTDSHIKSSLFFLCLFYYFPPSTRSQI